MIVAIWGKEKTLKTTLALTFPRPIEHFDLDVGGFDRAAWRFEQRPDGLKGINSTPYPAPLQIDKLMGKSPKDVSIRLPVRVVGMKELWQKFLQDYVKALESPDVKTIIIDSGTQMWEIIRQSVLQEKQEAQEINGKLPPGAKYRESLTQIEYSDPNNRSKSVIYAARSFNKNLVLTHYPRDVYKQKLTERGVESYQTGELEMDGFKSTTALVDLVIKTDVKFGENGATPIATITTSGLGLTLQGMTIENPSYEQIKNLIDMARGG